MTRPHFQTVDDYIASFPNATQRVLREIRRTIRQVLPGASEVISYQIPTFKIDGKPVIYFAGYSHHVSVYPLPHGDQALLDELAPRITGKGTVQFSLATPIPYGLIARIAQARLTEGTARYGE